MRKPRTLEGMRGFLAARISRGCLVLDAEPLDSRGCLMCVTSGAKSLACVRIVGVESSCYELDSFEWPVVSDRGDCQAFGCA